VSGGLGRPGKKVHKKAYEGPSDASPVGLGGILPKKEGSKKKAVLLTHVSRIVDPKEGEMVSILDFAC
jgi:hypothetical protein